MFCCQGPRHQDCWHQERYLLVPVSLWILWASNFSTLNGLLLVYPSSFIFFKSLSSNKPIKSNSLVGKTHSNNCPVHSSIFPGNFYAVRKTILKQGSFTLEFYVFTINFIFSLVLPTKIWKKYKTKLKQRKYYC